MRKMITYSHSLQSMHDLSWPSMRGMGIKNSLMSAVASILFSHLDCGWSVSSILMINMLYWGHAADWPGVGVVFDFLDLWAFKLSWALIVLALLLTTGILAKAWDCLSEVRRGGSGDDATSKLVGTVDPGCSETGDEGADGAAKAAADTIALRCEVRRSSPALSLVLVRNLI